MMRAVPTALVLVTVITALSGIAQPAVSPPRKLDIARQGCGHVSRMEFSANGSVLAVYGSGFLVREAGDSLSLWSVADGRHIRTLRGRDADGNFALSPDGKVLAVPHDRAGEIVVWDVPQGKEIHRLKHVDVYSVYFSPVGNVLASINTKGDSDRKGDQLIVWDPASGKQLYATKSEPEIHAAFASDGRLCFWGYDRRLRCWDPATRNERLPAVLPRDTDTFLIPSPSGNEVLARNRKGDRYRLHDTATGNVLRTFGDGKVDPDRAIFSADGKSLVMVLAEVGRNNSRIEVWETATGKRCNSFTVPNPSPISGWIADPVPDGKHVMVRQEHWSNGGLAYTDTALYTLDGRLVRRAPEVFDVVFDPSGRSVAVWHSSDADRPPVITIHDAAAWLAGGAKKH